MGADRLLWLNVLMAVLVLAAKWAVFRWTGSTAVFSDALESFVNVGTAFMVLWLRSIARRPPDRTHPYGHEKAESFAAMVEGGLVVFAGGAIVKEVMDAWAHGNSPRHLLEGMAVLAVLAGAYALWGGWLLREGGRRHSPAIRAEAQHILSDVKTTLAVVVGGWLTVATGFRWVDSLVALGIAVHIVWIGIRLIRESVMVLMDQAVEEEVEARIWEILRTFEGKIEGAHHLRTRFTGSRLFLDFDLVVDPEMTVREAHDLAHQVEAALRQAFPSVQAHIHIEPAEPHRKGFFPDPETQRSRQDRG